MACTPQRRPAGGCADVARLRLLPPPQHLQRQGQPSSSSTACQASKGGFQGCTQASASN